MHLITYLATYTWGEKKGTFDTPFEHISYVLRNSSRMTYKINYLFRNFRFYNFSKWSIQKIVVVFQHNLLLMKLCSFFFSYFIELIHARERKEACYLGIWKVSKLVFFGHQVAKSQLWQMKNSLNLKMPTKYSHWNYNTDCFFPEKFSLSLRSGSIQILHLTK